MTYSFEAKAQIVAGAFYDRFNEVDDLDSSEVLIKIFNSHDLSGPVALAYCQGDIAFSGDQSKIWIEDTFNALNAIFEFPPEDKEPTVSWANQVNGLDYMSDSREQFDPNLKSPSIDLDISDSQDDAFQREAQIVGSAFYNRFDEDGEAEILTAIFESHDLSGAIALAFMGGDIELMSNKPKAWIKDTFAVLNSIFDFPDDELKSTPSSEPQSAPITESELFVDYLGKTLKIDDSSLRDQITTRHHIEVNSGFAWIGIDDTDCEDLKLDLFFDTHAQISTIHASPNEQEIVGIVALPYGPWTMPGEWGSTYVKHVNNLNEGDIIPASFLLEGCDKIHFSSDFIENEKPRIYSIKGNLGISSYWESSWDPEELEVEYEVLVPMSGDFIIGSLIDNDSVKPEHLQPADQDKWNQWPFIVIRKDIYDRMSAAN